MRTACIARSATCSPTSVTKECTSTATASSPPGSYPITCSGGAGDNYSIGYVAGTLTIGNALLIVTASSGTMTYGGTPPAITPIYSGFLNGDDASDLTSEPACSTTATSASSVGSYPSTCSGGSDDNYAFFQRTLLAEDAFLRSPCYRGKLGILGSLRLAGNCLGRGEQLSARSELSLRKSAAC